MENSYINSDSIINVNEYKSIEHIAICSICDGILFNPMQCQSCENCFCYNCIDEWQKKSKSCPFHCENFIFKPSKTMSKLLEKMKFKCEFGCSEIIPYNDLEYHYTQYCTTLGLGEKYELLLKEYNELKTKNIELKKKAYKKPHGMEEMMFETEHHQHGLVKCITEQNHLNKCFKCLRVTNENEYVFLCSFCNFVYCIDCQIFESQKKRNM